MKKDNVDKTLPFVNSTLEEKFEAYDNLPHSVRKVVANGPLDYCAAEVKKFYLKARLFGYSEQMAVEAIARGFERQAQKISAVRRNKPR